MSVIAVAVIIARHDLVRAQTETGRALRIVGTFFDQPLTRSGRKAGKIGFAVAVKIGNSDFLKAH